MRSRIAPLPRFLTTVAVAKHRLFVWTSSPTLPDHAVFVFARSDDYFFGVLHSRFHEVWALRMGTRLETRPRYTPTTCFETFPFPPGVIPEPRTLNPDSPLAAIASAARELNTLRENWLNPPEWTRTETLEFPGTVGGPWDRYILNPEPRTLKPGAIAPVRYPRLVPRDAACAARLKDRTLTKLYNTRPAWLADCHARLDAAVAAAYGWPTDLTDDAILERLLTLNLTCRRVAEKE
jgi:type II restriction/modification system DNA methylase subunit YeeA